MNVKDLELGFFNLLGELGRSASIVFLLDSELDCWPSHR